MLFDKIVSLGSSCFISSEMRLLNKRFEAMPFDFIESNLHHIQQALSEDGFDHCFGQWLQNEPFIKHDIRGGFEQMRIPHHDPIIHEQHFNRCWKRWTNMLIGEHTILFIHINHLQYEKYLGVSDYQVKLLQDIKNKILLKYPDLKFHILSLHPYIVDEINDPLKIHSKESNLTFIQPCFTIPLNYHWLTERDVWDNIWNQLFELYPLNLPNLEPVDEIFV